MFTETVAQVVFRSGRRDRLPSIEATVNHVLQEIHAKASWARDLKEDRVIPTFSNPRESNKSFTWQEPKFFRVMQAVRVNGYCWLNHVRPSAGQKRHENYFYKAGDCYVFYAYQGIQWVDIAFYSRSPHLKCFGKNEEPARFDRETEEWSYLSNGEYGTNLLTTEEELRAQERVGNWILNRWQEVVINGALARLYADTRDDRQSNQWALYQNGIKDMKRYEAFGDEGPS